MKENEASSQGRKLFIASGINVSEKSYSDKVILSNKWTVIKTTTKWG